MGQYEQSHESTLPAVPGQLYTRGQLRDMRMIIDADPNSEIIKLRNGLVAVSPSYVGHEVVAEEELEQTTYYPETQDEEQAVYEEESVITEVPDRYRELLRSERVRNISKNVFKVAVIPYGAF